jgi:poly(3-hydroxybutyrate) depolymerase
LIYRAYDFALRKVTPLAGILDASHKLIRHEANPFRNTLAHRTVAALCEAPARALKHYPKQAYGVRAWDSGVLLEEYCIKSLPFADLVRFETENAASKPKVLIAAALSGHHSTLLRDTVRGFARDFDAYITDWKDAKSVPLADGDFGLDDYVDYLIQFIEELGPDTHIVATCQSAPPAMVAAAILAKRNPALVPASITLMAGPVDTRAAKNILNKITDNVPLDLFRKLNIMTVPKGHPGSGRRVYPGFYQLAGFVSLGLPLHAKKHATFIKDAIAGNHEEADSYRDFYDEYNAVLDATESFYMETLQRIFFEHHIPTGKMTFRGELVDFTLLKDTALLTVEGGKDNMCPPGQTKAAHGILSGIADDRRRHHVQEGVGHYGVFSGSRFQNDIYPVIRDFIQELGVRPA